MRSRVALRLSTGRIGQLERDVVRLADALNQFAMKTEDVAMRELQGSEARLDHAKAQRRYREKFQAARTLREDVAPIIERLDP